MRWSGLLAVCMAAFAGANEVLNPTFNRTAVWKKHGTGKVTISTSNNRATVVTDSSNLIAGIGQVLTLNQSAPSTITAEIDTKLSGTFKKSGNKEAVYGLLGEAEYQDGSKESVRLVEVSPMSSTYKTFTGKFTPPKPIKTLTVIAMLRYHQGKAMFTRVSIEEEPVTPSATTTTEITSPTATPTPPAPSGVQYVKIPTGVTWQLRAWCGPGERCHSGSVAGKSVVDVDLFDVSASEIKKLADSGLLVLCYYSAGTYEAWRPDAKSFPRSLLTVKMSGWDETWLDIRKTDLLYPIMAARIQLAKKKGCHGVEPDNVDCWSNKCVSDKKAEDKGMYQQQLKYNKWSADYAHSLGLAIGLKNDLPQIPDLVNYYDYAVNEECHERSGECKEILPFIKQNKAVLATDYKGPFSKVCNAAATLKFSQKVDSNGQWKDCSWNEGNTYPKSKWQYASYIKADNYEEQDIIGDVADETETEVVEDVAAGFTDTTSSDTSVGAVTEADSTEDDVVYSDEYSQEYTAEHGDEAAIDETEMPSSDEFEIVNARTSQADKTEGWLSVGTGATWENRAWCGAGRCRGGSVDGTIVFVDLDDTQASEIADIKSKGKSVICHFSAGTHESFRQDSIAPTLMGKSHPVWMESWLDIRKLDSGLDQWIQSRIDLASKKGCNGIAPDNVDCWQNECVDGEGPGSQVMYQAQLKYNKFIASRAHAKGLSVGLHNDLDQIGDLVGDFDWAVVESCNKYNECRLVKPFVDAGKAVFAVEYGGSKENICAKASAYGLSMLLNVGGTWQAC